MLPEGVRKEVVLSGGVELAPGELPLAPDPERDTDAVPEGVPLDCEEHAAKSTTSQTETSSTRGQGRRRDTFVILWFGKAQGYPIRRSLNQPVGEQDGESSNTVCRTRRSRCLRRLARCRC
jgi:hypothetical protein